MQLRRDDARAGGALLDALESLVWWLQVGEPERGDSRPEVVDGGCDGAELLETVRRAAVERVPTSGRLSSAWMPIVWSSVSMLTVGSHRSQTRQSLNNLRAGTPSNTVLTDCSRS